MIMHILFLKYMTLTQLSAWLIVAICVVMVGYWVFEFKGMPNEERYSRAERYLAHSLAVHVCLLEVAGGFSSLRALTPFEKARIGLFSRKCPIELDHNFHSSLNLSLCFPSMYVMDLLYE